jgi:hypothetical protein
LLGFCWRYVSLDRSIFWGIVLLVSGIDSNIDSNTGTDYDLKAYDLDEGLVHTVAILPLLLGLADRDTAIF